MFKCVRMDFFINLPNLPKNLVYQTNILLQHAVKGSPLRLRKKACFASLNDGLTPLARTKMVFSPPFALQCRASFYEKNNATQQLCVKHARQSMFSIN